MAGKHYSLEVKTEAIRMVVEPGMTHRAIEEVLGIRGRSRIKEWMRAYRREGQAAFTKPNGRPPSDQSEFERLRMENALLKKFR